MTKLVLIGGLGVTGAIVLGVGMSLIHSGGYFSPSEPDWLTVSRTATPAPVPAPSPEPVPAISESIQLSETVTRYEENGVTAPVAEANLAPETSTAPIARPTELAVITPAPQVLPETSEDFAAIPSEFGPSVVEDLQTRSKAPTPFDQGPNSLLAPPELAQSAPDPIDRVWLLGVYR